MVIKVSGQLQRKAKDRGKMQPLVLFDCMQKVHTPFFGAFTGMSP